MAVVMVYPDKRYIHWDPLHPGKAIGLNVWERVWTKSAIGITKKEFRRRAGLINKLLDSYRKEGHRVYWAVFSEDCNSNVPERKSIHPVYKVRSKDTIIPVGVSYRKLNQELQYPDAKKVLEGIDLGERAIFGGFHESDCVGKFASAACELGVPVTIDNFLTEGWFGRLDDSLRQDMYAYQIRKGDLDAEMHEDDPEEEKLRIFESRLTAEDLALRR
ncbi:hypothetical protein KW787_02845 [Candidatus Pacearchaeota archaeon]|nr:hypothetical protein [Candidatus Pacearchaeota archaeon]